MIGAIIDLGYCFDLTDTAYLRELKKSYELAVEYCRISGEVLPENKPTNVPTTPCVACSGRADRSTPMRASRRKTTYRFASATLTASKAISCQETSTRIIPTHKGVIITTL